MYNEKRLREKPIPPSIAGSDNRNRLPVTARVSNRSGRWTIASNHRSKTPSITIVHDGNSSSNDIQIGNIEVDNSSDNENSEDNLICLSPDSDFFIHSPSYEHQSNQKIDVVSGYTEFELTVNILSYSVLTVLH